jgi:hypothetical protein
VKAQPPVVQHGKPIMVWLCLALLLGCGLVIALIALSGGKDGGTKKAKDETRQNTMAFKGDSPGEGKGQPGAARPGGKEPGGKAGAKGQGKGEGKAPGDKSGKGEGKGDSGMGEQSGDDKGDKAGDGKGEDGKGEDGKDEKSQQGDKEGKSGGRGRNSDPGKSKGMKDIEKGAKDNSSQSSSLAKMQQMLQRVGPVLKWIVFAILAFIVVLALLRGGLGFLANFTDWAKRLLAAWRNFWANLFGRAKTDAMGAGVVDEPAPVLTKKV